MTTRLKSQIILGFIWPGIFLILSVSGSFCLYQHTVKVARERQALACQLDDLQAKLQSHAAEQSLIQGSMEELRGYFSRATTDGFITSLMSNPANAPEITSSSSKPQSNSPTSPGGSTQQLTLLGNSNTLILALGQAQRAFPTVIPLKCQIRKTTKPERLEFSTSWVISDLSMLSLAPAVTHAPTQGSSPK